MHTTTSFSSDYFRVKREMTIKGFFKQLRSSLRNAMRRHETTHDHDLLKVFSILAQVIGGLVVHLVILSDASREHQALAAVIVFSITTLIIAVVNSTRILFGIRTHSKDREKWLTTTSEILVLLGVISYYIGDNLPSILANFNQELNCNAECQEGSLIAGVVLLLLSLSTFTFIPEIFRKIHKVVNEEYDPHGVRNEKDQLRYYVLRMIALTLEFDTAYTAVWEYAFVDVTNCDIYDIIGSSACILVGWITWEVYAVVYAYYLTDVRGVIQKFKYKGEGAKTLNSILFATLVLFFVTFFPVHILTDNAEPLSCGCRNHENITLDTIYCESRSGVIETRVALYMYQIVLFSILGVIAAVKYSMKQTN